MRTYFILSICLVLITNQLIAQTSETGVQPKPKAISEEGYKAMSEAYWKIWSPEIQSKIDRDIDQNRKADANIKLENITPGTVVKVEQISSDFIFGAHIFNFNQLGTKERNQKYKNLYGTLFNSATIAFYWKKFEMQPNRPRFKEEYWDTEAYWNSVKAPKEEPHWRRPASDPVVEFCESKGIRLHGHNLIWGNRKWQYPEWIFEAFCPQDEKAKILQLEKDGMVNLTPDQIAKLAPVYFKEMKRLYEKRVVELINYYGGRLQSWDVVNESSVDFYGQSVTGDLVCKSSYGLMPGDYVYDAFKLAGQLFPKNVKLNINDYKNDANYVNQTKDLMAHGCRIDIMGSQMHLFNPQQCLDIAEGKEIQTPKQVWDVMETIGKAGLPIHLSEITITSPGDNAHGREIQAVIARNLYRLWFSIKPMMGITWWNVVDDCGAPREPSVSGLFTRNMEPKPSYFALNNLINNEWKTKTEVKSGENGNVKFRGFKGNYQISWKDNAGKIQTRKFYLKNNGDGL
jgi:GH35 family endo-1,4-beta-xylanase